METQNSTNGDVPQPDAVEIDGVNFSSRLLSILVALSEAHFVSLDLELSGVVSKPPNSSRSRQTLEQRYREVKEAAEKYQILQVGLTCVEQDYHTNKYLLRPYNINLSPLIEERLDIERIFSFQSGAVDFLLRNGFRMDLPFTRGVQYLSRAEAALAKQLAYDRLEKRTIIEDLQLEAEAVESLDFIRRVREAIIQWDTAQKEAHLDISARIRSDTQSEWSSLSRFEKRLVHQLVRAEFPNLVVLSRETYMRIIYFDSDREAQILRKRKREVQEKIAKQTGFRWIVEAMVGGSLKELDPCHCARNTQGNHIFIDVGAFESRLHRAQSHLKDRQPVLVGHNMFTDLVYFYRSFIGDLPETVQEFSRAIHTIFPVVVDTKYLATHNCGDINPVSSLQDIAEQLDMQEKPIMHVHPDHTKYNAAEPFHEAGFDSLNTAKIMIRLAAKLDASGIYKDELVTSVSKESNMTAPKELDKTLLPETSSGKHSAVLTIDTEQVTTPTTPPGAIANSLSAPAIVTVKKKRRKTKKPKAAAGRYAHATLFETLRTLDLEESEDTSSPDQDEPVATLVDGQLDWQNAPYEQQYPEWRPPTPIKKEPMAVMPQFDSDFWKVYGNKLRVFGTVEGVLKLTD